MNLTIDVKMESVWSFVLIAFLSTIFIDANAGTQTITLIFKDSTLVNDTFFTVGDIALVTGEDGVLTSEVRNCVVGVSAPPGYGRFVSTNNFVSITLKQKFKHVDFTISGAKRSLVRSDYRVVRLSDHELNLRSWIDTTIGWKAGEWTITILNSGDSCRSWNKPIALSFFGLENRYPKGNTTLLMRVNQDNTDYRIPVRCHFSVITSVLTASTLIPRGKVLSPEDCEVRKMDISRFTPIPYTSMISSKNRRAARTINPGTILHDRLFQAVPIIEKGDQITIVLKNSRISIIISGIARENGGIGDRIWVENRTTHKIIRAKIQEKGIVTPLHGEISI